MTPLGPWLLVLLCSPLWHTEGVNGWGVSPVPSESECRPHIEKALKEKELTLETQQEAVDAADSEHTAHPSPPAEQEGSIEETEEAITKESADESTSHEAHQQSDVVSAETAESKEDASIENQAVESSETPVEGESIESAETQESVPEETIGEEKKTEDSLETGSKEQTSIEDESQSVETDEKTEATSIEDTAAEQLSAETPDETTKEKTSLEEETKSEEVSLEQTKEEHEAASELSNEAVEDKKSEEASVEGPSAEKQSVEENLNETKEESTETKEETTEPKEEFTEKTNTSEDLTTSNEDQTVENSVESPGGEITDSLENADSLENKESTEPQESVETTTEEPKDSVEKSEEKPEASREDTKEAVSEEQNETKPAVEESLETTESDKTESSETSKENLTESTTSTETVQDVTNLKIEATPTEGEKQENADEAQKESTEEAATEQDPAAAEEVVKEQEPTVEDQLTLEFEMPKVRRSREHIGEILRLTPESAETELLLAKTTEATLKELKKLYDVAIKPLEILYKYRDLSNRHFGDPEIFSKPLILFMGPWSGGKSTILNYLLDNEFKSSSLRTGAEPSPAYFNILMWGEREEVMDGTQLAADWTFSGLQKFGQGLLDRLRGLRLNAPLLEKVNIVEIPGILEIRKQVERLFPFNDACQWFIDRADIIFLVYDPSKLDVGPETEAILDQLKGREYQTRIILNKADQVKPEELMRVQGTLIWNISPLMSSQEPPVMYSTSLWSIPYEQGAPSRLLHAQERAFLRDMRQAIDKRVENKIASARRFAVRVRNHAKMVDCYLTTYYNHKTFFGNRKKVADDIVEHPQNYHIYEGLSTLTNISRYDLPDPEVYRDFFRLNALYDFQRLSDTCTYFRGCPINRLDVAIAYDLPELVGKWKKQAERVLDAATEKQGKS